MGHHYVSVTKDKLTTDIAKTGILYFRETVPVSSVLFDGQVSLVKPTTSGDIV